MAFTPLVTFFLTFLFPALHFIPIHQNCYSHALYVLLFTLMKPRVLHPSLFTVLVYVVVVVIIAAPSSVLV